MKADRKFELLLYPDSTSYNCQDVLKTAEKVFCQWAWILHDKDLEDDGSNKKAHIHFYGKLDTSRSADNIAYAVGVPVTSLRNIQRWKGAIRYLIHLDNPEKAQYLVSDIHANFNISPLLKYQDDDAMAFMILQYIKDNNYPSIEQLTEFCITNNLWSAFRRGFAVWCKLCRF